MHKSIRFALIALVVLAVVVLALVVGDANGLFDGAGRSKLRGGSF